MLRARDPANISQKLYHDSLAVTDGHEQ
jgi:hypothetical protein